MTGSRKGALFSAAATIVLGAMACGAQEREHGEREHGERDQGRPAHVEPHQGPRGYERAPEPHGWNNRPHEVDRAAYQHNYQARRSYRIGPYHRPHGWAAHRWAHGEILPRAYWAPEYVVGDYWLFALDVPPVGYEWVRDDHDALLVDTQTGEILQVEYGVFG
jgi:Ni/Co efflux regulator RcnB